MGIDFDPTLLIVPIIPSPIGSGLVTDDRREHRAPQRLSTRGC